MRITLLAIILLSLCENPTLAQETNRILDDEMGISFAVPQDWQATKEEDRYIMGSTGISGFMLIKTESLHSINELKEAMEAGIETKDGSIMTPAQDLSLLGQQGVAGLYHGKIDDVEMTGYLMALMNASKEKTVLCISISPSSNFNQSNLDYVKILLRSVIFE